MIKLRNIGIWFLSLTWGFIMTTIGLCAALILLIAGYKPHKFGPFIYFEVGYSWGGVNLGPVFIVQNNCSRHTLEHESGHGIQNICFGFLMPFVIGIPSAIRYHYRNYLQEKKGMKFWQLPDYDAIWFEGMASTWGHNIFKEEEVEWKKIS